VIGFDHRISFVFCGWAAIIALKIFTGLEQGTRGLFLPGWRDYGRHERTTLYLYNEAEGCISSKNLCLSVF
jgi:hypothetical protein